MEEFSPSEFKAKMTSDFGDTDFDNLREDPSNNEVEDLQRFEDEIKNQGDVTDRDTYEKLKRRKRLTDNVKSLMDELGISPREKAVEIVKIMEVVRSMTMTTDSQNGFPELKKVFTGDTTFDMGNFVNELDRLRTFSSEAEGELNGQTNAEDFHKQLLSKIFGKELAEQILEGHKKAMVDKTNGTTIDSNDITNDTKSTLKKLGESINKLWNSLTVDNLGKLLKNIGKLIKFLAPFIGIWLAYNLIAFTFSRCYWNPVNSNCNFKGHDAGDWKKMSTQKYDNILPGDATPNYWDRLISLPGTHIDTKTKCKCPSDQGNYFITYATQDDEYGTVITNKPDGAGGKFNKDQVSGASRGCTTGDENTVPCGDNTGKDSKSFPMCIRQYDSNSNTDVATLGNYLNVPTGTNLTPYTDPPSVCIGTYQYYECDLSEMMNGFANFVKDVLSELPMIGSLLKKIIYIIVVIVIIFFAMYFIRMFMTMERKQSFNGRGRKRLR